MKKLAVVLAIIFITQLLYADEKTDNPGYLKSPVMIMLGGAQSYTGTGTNRDNNIRPHLFVFFNLLQSEYGNLALSTAFTYQTPKRTYQISDSNFKLKSDLYVGELGLNYTTGSRGFNLILGAGYNWTIVKSELKQFHTGGVGSAYTKSFNQVVNGWHYYLGMQYIVKNNWGIFFIFRGQETKRAKFDIDEMITYSNGNSSRFSADFNKNLNNKSYIMGFSYNF